MKEKSKTGVVPTRQENFPEWYQSVIKAADMAENAPVRGCMIIKPYGFALWENIQRQFDAMIKEEGVQNAYFPLLIPLSYIAKEAEHIDGFAKECAVVTHHRLSKNARGELAPDPTALLTEPMIIRPTSETIIGESMHNWIHSYRDLPLKLNQWCNVMRWEMRPRLFLRTTEFLWQEGHNAFATAEEADHDARHMLDLYERFIEQHLAIPVIKGKKTPEERFPGAVETYTTEALMQDGKALQTATSHHLGQTFSKSSDIRYLDKDGAQKFAWTTSWGMSTRTIGGMIMTHGDDDGMIMPPQVAPYQIIIIPMIHREEDRARIMEYCDAIRINLQTHQFSARIDATDERNADKTWNAIRKGVPIRLEIGGREVNDHTVTYVRRDLGKEGKATIAAHHCEVVLKQLLQNMQASLLQRARERMAGQIKDVQHLHEIRDYYALEQSGALKIDYHLIQSSDVFKAMQKEFALTTRCLPFADGSHKVIISKAY